jgi:predicted HTH domain antitoxin
MRSTLSQPENEVNPTTPVEREIAALIRLGLYESQEEVVADAIRNLLLNNRSLRLDMALDLFKTGEVSLGRAAEIAGVDRWQFQEVLQERHINSDRSRVC